MAELRPYNGMNGSITLCGKLGEVKDCAALLAGYTRSLESQGNEVTVFFWSSLH